MRSEIFCTNVHHKLQAGQLSRVWNEKKILLLCNVNLNSESKEQSKLLMENLDREFSAIYRDYYRRIKKLCLGYTHSIYEAEDLVQETFFSAWKHWESFKGNASRTTWIYRIAVNKCLSHIKRSVQKPDFYNEFGDSPEDEYEHHENVHLLYDAISKLQKIDRLLITMFLDELTYREIAEALGMRENTVAVRIHRIKKQLTEIFNSYEKL